MNVENLARQAVQIIKNQWGLPSTGFLAGGSIANIIWEIVSGNKAVVNDVDIFHFVGFEKKQNTKDKTSLFNFQKHEKNFYEDYTGLCFTLKTKDFYSIVKAEREEIFNHIDYKSNTEDPQLIINSFDINACKVGYHIDTDTIHFTKEFVDFLETGKLKVCNLITPCHTAVRIAKKSKDLNVILDDFELKLIQYSLTHSFYDKMKWRFKDKYQQMFETNFDILSKFFKISRDTEIEDYVLQKHGVDTKLYYLESLCDFIKEKDVFDDKNLRSINSTIDFIFYMRNISNNESLKQIWSKLYWYFNTENYVDKDVELEDIELLNRFSLYAPDSIENLKGYKLSEQIDLIKKFLDKYKDDPLVAISILEKIKVQKDIELDDETALLLELSVRKKIINDTRGKVAKILQLPTPIDSVDDNSLPF